MELVDLLLDDLVVDLAHDVSRERRDGQGRWTESTMDREVKHVVDSLETMVRADGGPDRRLMPQLSGVPAPGSKGDKIPHPAGGEVDLTDQFEKELRAQGVSVVSTAIDVHSLKPTQDQLVAGKVRGIAEYMATAPANDRVYEPIFVTKDDYVIDGHHRWAGQLVNARIDGTDRAVRVRQVNLDREGALAAATKFMQEWGLPVAGMTHSGPAISSFTAPKDLAFDNTEARHPNGRWMHLAGLMKAGGFTSMADGSVPTSGYAVGVPSKDGKDHRALPHGQTTPEEIAQFAADFKDDLAKPHRGIGGWSNDNPEYGDVRDALDIVEVHDDLDEALRLAHAAGQDAIYDLADQAEIKVPKVLPKHRKDKITGTYKFGDAAYDFSISSEGNVMYTLKTTDLAVTPNGRPGDASPLGKPGSKRQLSDYEREIAHALIRKGKSRRDAIRMARGLLKKANATGRWGDHGKAGAKTRAGAAASIAQRKTF